MSSLVKKAADGETIFIGGYGKAQAALVSIDKIKPQKRLGLLAGKFVVPDDFDAPLPQSVLEGFYGT